MNNLLTQKFPIAAFALLFVLTMSCSHEPAVEPQESGGTNVAEWNDSAFNGDAVMGEMMMFRVGDSLQVIRKASTRLSTAFDGQSYTLSGDERITIAMKRGSESEVIKIYKVKDADTGALEYEKDADNNVTEPFYWKSTTETVKLRAWSYGTSEAYTSDPLTTPFTLNTTQTELVVGKDNYRELLYGKQRDYPYAANITLNLYHQLARITVELTHSDNEKALSIATNGVTIGGGVLPTSAQFVAPAGDSNIGSWEDLQTNSGTVTARTDVANQKYSAVVFPKTYSAGTKIVGVTTTAESPWNSYAYTLPLGGEELEAGKQYNYKVNVRDLVLVSGLTVSDIAAVTYNGSAQTPEPTVTDPESGKVLTKDTHYTLSYTNNTNAGTATCTITGLGIYSGTITKDFVIEKKPATITLNASSKSLVDGTSGAITATLSEYDDDASISLTNANTAYYTTSNSSLSGGATTITITGVDVCSAKSFNVDATSSNYSYTSQSCAVTITISALMKPGNYIAYNPLWYVCQYNCASSGAFETSHKTSGSYAWTFSGATSLYGTGNSKSMNGGTYHLPNQGEWRSLMPAHSLTTGYMYLSDPNSTYTETGVKVAKNRTVTLGNSTSYWAYNNSDGWTYAVRYVSGNTSINQYCSAWRYKRVSSPCNALCIESYQLKTAITNETDAKTVLGMLPSSTVWSGTANVSHTLAPSNSSLVRRYFPCTGYSNNGTGQTNSDVNSGGRFWSSEAYIMLLFDFRNTSDLMIYVLSYDNGNIGRCVRLFRE